MQNCLSISLGRRLKSALTPEPFQPSRKTLRSRLDVRFPFIRSFFPGECTCSFFGIALILGYMKQRSHLGTPRYPEENNY